MLCVRNMRFYARNPELLLAKLFTYIFMGGFMGAYCPLVSINQIRMTALCNDGMQHHFMCE